MKHCRNEGLRRALDISLMKLLPDFMNDRNTWGLYYAIKRTLIQAIPANPFYKRYVNSRISVTPKLQIGAGDSICTGWLHQDLKKYQTRRHKNLNFIINVMRLVKYINKDSLESVMASHIIEHLPRHEAIELLSSIYSWLKHDGQLWLSVPDLTILHDLAKDHNSSNIDRERALLLISTPYPGHVSCWLFEDLVRILTSIGFRHVERWAAPPDEFKGVSGCWNAHISGKLISLNLVATK